MNYAPAHTSIPIPAVLEVHFGNGDIERGWFLMERIPGMQLDEAWPIMTEASRARTISEVKEYLPSYIAFARLNLGGLDLALEDLRTIIA
ncbi:hypothetical protein Forpe1208_v014216 [Fusarium oxysporum f. sp. rapae]|uniref:Uncharacterized protein n=1 Tax=Fusarium oxysporum f. sp. rapae TaxID=485398 RepID=A0A8J5TQF3_FUSOX|nr:hypothetical protein Forpe1208_v014216 [Fusarium oxysporum f. sp. rapae]